MLGDGPIVYDNMCICYGDGPIVYDNTCICKYDTVWDRQRRILDAQIEEQQRQEGMSQWSRKLEVG
jgi:hypothetical protein